MAKNLVNRTLRLSAVGMYLPEAELTLVDDTVKSISYSDGSSWADKCIGMSEQMVRDWAAGYFAEYDSKVTPSILVTALDIPSLVGMVAHEPLKTQMINLLETHYEVSAFLSQMRDRLEIPSDRTECFTLAREWTMEFEEKNLGRLWDGEFYDEIDAFCEQKMAQYLNK